MNSQCLADQSDADNWLPSVFDMSPLGICPVKVRNENRFCSLMIFTMLFNGQFFFVMDSCQETIERERERERGKET